MLTHPESDNTNNFMKHFVVSKMLRNFSDSFNILLMVLLFETLIFKSNGGNFGIERDIERSKSQTDREKS